MNQRLRTFFFCLVLLSLDAVAETITSQLPAKAPVLQHLAGAYWRVDGAFASRILITNILAISPLRVTPVIYMADGIEFDLKPITLAANGVSVVSINEALQGVSPEILARASSFGSAGLKYMYPYAGAAVATVQNIDPVRSLNYTFPMSTFGKSAASSTTITKNGLWWKYNAEVEGFVAVTNTGISARTVVLQLRSANGVLRTSTHFSLLPNATQVLTLSEMKAGRDSGDGSGSI